MCLIKPFQALLTWFCAHATKLFSSQKKHKTGEEDSITTMATREVFLELHKGQNNEQNLFRVSKGDWVTFLETPSLYGLGVKLYTNLPDEGKNFDRAKYREIEIKKIRAHISGSFHYYFTLDNSTEINGQGYILVEPQLSINGKSLPLDAIQCVTYLSKCLGPLTGWIDILSVAKEAGYNMIHFTPIQELGGSKSAYCLKNQLSINPDFGSNKKISYEDIEKLVKKIKQDWGILSICDIVLNHTANESAWLQDHPESTYNLLNSRHLRPAYILDLTINKCFIDIAKGELEMVGIPCKINCEDHLNALRYQLADVLIPKANIVDMFLLDIQEILKIFQERSRCEEPSKWKNLKEDIEIIQDPEYRRLKSGINMDLALTNYNVFRTDCFDEDTRQRKCAEAFKARLDAINNQRRLEIEHHLRSAADNIVATVRYFMLDQSGPKIAQVTENDLFVSRYFIELKKIDESEIFTDKSKYVMAHNGWVMDYDPLTDFADPDSNVYLRRELIAWGDSVKLRYGTKREDCPFLWDHMKEYVTRTAKIFDGVRIDNCHTTPIPVAEFLLDAARTIKPELYVVGELFTNSDLTDNVFVNKLGITSLIRECMSGWESHEVGRLVYRYGGAVIGSFGIKKISNLAHALFMDQTHDNPSPIEIRTVYDLLPSAGLVSMAACASGSNMGYDQLVPHHIDVVKENRRYMKLSEANIGIMNAKLVLNELHSTLARDRFNQVFVDQINEDIICVTRHNPFTLESVLLFAYTAFKWPDGQSGENLGVTVDGIAHSVLFEAFLSHKTGLYAHHNDFKKDNEIINGLSEYTLNLKTKLSVTDSSMLHAVPCGQSTRLNLTNSFKPGSILAVKVVARTSAKDAAVKIEAGFDFEKIISKLDLFDINFALYRCKDEEGGSYHIPRHGDLVYCGIQGIMSILEQVALNDDLGHPICTNIRDGSWLANYTCDRLKNYEPTKPLGLKLALVFKLVDELPKSLKPSSFYKIISQVHSALIKRALSLMPSFVQDGNRFIQGLALCSVQLLGIVKSSPLPPLSSKIEVNKKLLEGPKICTTLAAGFPHFSSGYMRSWGRDTFISLRGLLLLTGRYEEAKYHILGYAGCLRHGLIPNLLNGHDINPRYNCRDAIWWWLYSIIEYTKLVSNGCSIINEKVNRLFPNDDSELTSVEQDLHQVMQEALQVHFQGLCFRERNAGKQIDEHMTSLGFDNQIGVHPVTGFVFGGNEWNCGTWMDKMGSSIEAGTKGKPATPRDGSAVEIIGLSHAVIKWLSEKNKEQIYPYDGVSRINKNGVTTKWTWAEWSDKIRTNFEKEFWVKNKDGYANRIEIIKDTVGATQPWSDFRLRPNFTIAMVVAQDLFNQEIGLKALNNAKVLVGPLGMKTLDPTDLAYGPNYDNSNNSSDYKVAHGFNYHQGPEWVWLTGYYLRACLKFAKDKKEAVKNIKQHIANHWNHLEKSHWKGLPELTNENGAFCYGSCTNQAWSAATIMEVLYDIQAIES